MADSELPPGLVREHLGRILASASFRAAESLRRLLRYTVETTLAGKGHELKEYTIGVEPWAVPIFRSPSGQHCPRAVPEIAGAAGGLLFR